MDYKALTQRFIDETIALNRLIQHSKGKHASKGQAFALQLLSQWGEAYSSRICEEMDVTTARMASILNDLESKGLVSRRIDAGDRRKIIVSITQAGREEAEENRRWIFEKLQQMLENLGAEDTLALIRILGRIIEMGGKATEKE